MLDHDTAVQRQKNAIAVVADGECQKNFPIALRRLVVAVMTDRCLPWQYKRHYGRDISNPAPRPTDSQFGAGTGIKPVRKSVPFLTPP